MREQKDTISLRCPEVGNTQHDQVRRHDPTRASRTALEGAGRLVRTCQHHQATRRCGVRKPEPQGQNVHAGWRHGRNGRRRDGLIGPHRQACGGRWSDRKCRQASGWHRIVRRRHLRGALICSMITRWKSVERETARRRSNRRLGQARPAERRLSERHMASRSSWYGEMIGAGHSDMSAP